MLARRVRASRASVQRVVAEEARDRVASSARRSRRVWSTRRSPYGTASACATISTTCASCRWRIRARRSSRVRSPPLSSWAPAAAALLDAYIVGFEIEGRFGRAMNPRHYQKGWHCTSTIGTLGAAAAASRLLGLDVEAARHAIDIAASDACGLKDNFGSMVKPLHAGACRPQRRPRRAAGARRPDRESERHSWIAGFPRRDGQRVRAARARPIPRRSRDALGDSRHRHHRQALSVVCRHASDTRYAARFEAARRVRCRRRPAPSRSASTP